MQNTPATSPVQTGTQTGAPQLEQVVGGPYTAREMYDAAQRHRRIVREQLANTEAERDQVAQQLRRPEVAGVDKVGLEERLKALDARVIDLQNQLSQAQTRESQAAALPGATTRSPQEVSSDRFEIVFGVTTVILTVLAIPIVLAWARRLWKKSSVTLSMTPELDRRLDSIEKAIDTTALEVERIGEGQRFVTQLMANRTVQEQAALSAPKESR